MMKKTNNLRKLNLGCGRDIKEEYINIDKAKISGVDVVHDLDKYPWPFKSNYFDEIYARDFIEHAKDLVMAMKEINRISRNNAKLRLIVPYWHSSCAFYPNHNYFFNVDSLKMFTEKNRSYDAHYGFELEDVKLLPSRFGRLIPPIPIPKALFSNVRDLRHLISYLLGEIILKIDFTLRVVKH
jgi:SAM-dependent methyltransferase